MRGERREKREGKKEKGKGGWRNRDKEERGGRKEKREGKKEKEKEGWSNSVKR